MVGSSKNESSILNLGELIDRSLDLSRVAVIEANPVNPRQVTYGELDSLANAVARGLSRFPIGRRDRVAIVAGGSVNFLGAYLGILRAGGVAVLINPRFSPNEISRLLQETECKAVFADSSFGTGLDQNIMQIIFGSNFSRFLDPGPFTAVSPEKGDPALMLFTSGSSSRPKGVVIPHDRHRWVVRRGAGAVANGQKGFRSPVILLAAPLFHMNGLSNAEISCLSHFTMVLLPTFDAKVFLRSIETYRVTSIVAVPAMLAMALRERPLVDQLDLSSVKNIRMGSAPLTLETLSAVRARFPNARDQIFNGYGLTEAGPALFGPHPKGLIRPDLSVGYPRLGIQYRIVDGVLQVKSPGMLKEYFRDLDKFRESVTEDGFFITKDRFRTDENGFYFFLGRADDMFVCGGENIYPSEVEAIMRRHPDVVDVAVVGIDDPIKGKKPYAFVVLRESASCDERALQEFALESAAAYLHPRRIWRLARIPYTATGKVERPVLEDMALRLLQGRSSEGDLVLMFDFEDVKGGTKCNTSE